MLEGAVIFSDAIAVTCYRPKRAAQFERGWQLSHKAHNKLMHIMHGNGSRSQTDFVAPCDASGIARAVLHELCLFVDVLITNGTLKSWMAQANGPSTAMNAVAHLARMVSTRQRKRSLNAAAAFKSVLEDSLKKLYEATPPAEVDQAVHFLTLLWTSNSPPFYYLLTYASRHGLEKHFEATFFHLRWALQRTKAPTVLAAEGVCSLIKGAPPLPPGGAFVWRGLPDESLLTPFKEDVKAGRLTAFSLLPTVAQLFGEVLVCVAVSAADLACFAHLVTTLTQHEQEVLLYCPCELIDEPKLASSWTSRCFHLRRLDEGGEAAAAEAAAAEAAEAAEVGRRRGTSGRRARA